jgi:hypothetical protein
MRVAVAGLTPSVRSVAVSPIHRGIGREQEPSIDGEIIMAAKKKGGRKGAKKGAKKGGRKGAKKRR